MESRAKTKEIVLLSSTFIIAICGLVYELLESTISSYLLGDSIYHFSLVIGLFMSSMGIGAWLSRFIEERLERAFVLLQMSISIIGGFSAFFLFYAFAYIDNYQPFLYIITILLGSMLGVEIPIIIRILKESFSLKSNISNVFTLDYIGALFAALLFPLVLVPQLGLMQTSFFFGLLNLFVGVMAWSIFRRLLGIKYLLAIIAIATILILGLIYSNRLVDIIENRLYQHSIIFSKQTKYQKLIVTSQKGRVAFYINGAIQFDSIDEYRYHEALVHLAMSTTYRHDKVLIIGGGDGMALREVLKYDTLKDVTLVDLDPAITKLFRDNKILSQLNHNSYNNPKVKVINQDAWKFLEESNSLYDVIIVDLPDPNNISLSRLYSKTFYHLLGSHLSHTGAIVTQSTSPLFSKKAFWSINKTIKESSLHTLPYHTYIPSFGEWGFNIASHIPIKIKKLNPKIELKYLNDNIIKQMQIFPKDMSQVAVETNTLIKHQLLYYYEEGWREWYER